VADKTLLSASKKWPIIHEQLILLYGLPEWRQHLPPVDELISTILSQNTTDTNRDRAFFALKETFPDWQMVIDADELEVMAAIRQAGLANQKAPRIQQALKTIKNDKDGISLDFLAELPLDEAKNWLTSINGVGPKTAAIVLLFSFNRPAFPVDTHVYRLSKRLGLIEQKISVEKAHILLEGIVNPEAYYSFHLNLIRHGREVCSARNPKCELCPLQDLCSHYKFVIKGTAKKDIGPSG
jgi:endonuclease-3